MAPFRTKVHNFLKHVGIIGTWAQIDKTTSDIADITTKSHTSLTDKGTNTHTQIDTHISATSSVHNFDASGNAPAQTHNNTRHSETYITSANTGFFRQFWQKQGTVVAGTWTWAPDAGQTDYASVTGEGVGVYENTTHADLDEYKWENIFLPPGSYKITIVCYKYTDAGILEILFGTTSLGTLDEYSASVVRNVVTTFTFTLAAATTADFRVRVNGKNASSSNHYIYWSRLQLEKTG